ncbi:HD domain-containing phosphohydrolase [Clostridium uliginosum]|uniref:HDIG domain-containing protein n=1 Tax=Clostridium uliginosum TaxID=119641 RepID=A0A1I1SKX5_9CLOT|nr:HD domain-containing phosphohydrolase [Clostridium uliginosum]SFD46962.1 HDIG domain-containing protein [Clostridium uliginosum]
MKKEVSLKDILIIIQRGLNSVDKRLLDHGEKVAYILLKMLKTQGKYSQDHILKLCTLAIFHDIGAYKVTERDKLLDIDSIAPINHAIYGSLFIKYFSPVADLSEVVLGHHFTAGYLKKRSEIHIPNEALILGLADYIALIHLKNNVIEEKIIINKKVDYLEENINLFLEASKSTNFNEYLSSNIYKKELYDFFDIKSINKEEIIKYIKMLAYTIDFRSKATVRHTIVVEGTSYEIAKLYGIDEDEAVRIKIAATLHDIGKIAIPVSILEKPGKLTTEEFEIMKSHVDIGYKMLSNLGIDDIRDIAMAHHEKLDGTGYPFGLKDEEISKEARIVAIADIFSALTGVRSYKDEFSKSKIISILTSMASEKKIDLEIVNLVLKNYDHITKKVKEETNELMNLYENLESEYSNLLEKFA